MIELGCFFDKKVNGKERISISLSQPRGYKLKSCPKLAPSWSILKEWLDSNKGKEAQIRYTNRYINEILSKVTINEVVKELDGKVLVCWCKPGNFCHRNIVADWLEHNGIAVVRDDR